MEKTCTIYHSNSFWPICQLLQQGTFVDLTHTFDANSPSFEKAKPMEIEVISTIDQDGYLVQRFHFEGQWGTHVDAPSHFFKDLRALHEIDTREMVLPLVVIDVHTQVKQNSDYVLKLTDIQEWEKRYGLIPSHSFVALRTDWSKRWPHHTLVHNRDAQQVAHTPGWSVTCLKYLFEERKITAIGHETIDPDPGMLANQTNWECERYVLGRNHYQIELLTNLDQCPATGALLICTFPKAQQASGFPARLIAICPPKTN